MLWIQETLNGPKPILSETLVKASRLVDFCATVLSFPNTNTFQKIPSLLQLSGMEKAFPRLCHEDGPPGSGAGSSVGTGWRGLGLGGTQPGFGEPGGLREPNPRKGWRGVDGELGKCLVPWSLHPDFST